MHRADAVCHWCGEVKSPWRLSGPALRSAAAIALTVTAAGGVWRYGPALRDVTTSFAARMEEHAEQPVATPYTPAATPPSQTPPSASVAEVSPVAPSSAAVRDSILPLPMGVDSVQWTPAVARTWVNVRSDASRGGEVVGVIKPAARAMLGSDSAGWRQVRLSDVTGWVDPRLFEPDSLRTRGE